MGEKIMDKIIFLTIKNYAAIIYPSLAHIWLCIIDVGCFKLMFTHVVHQQKFMTLHQPIE